MTDWTEELRAAHMRDYPTIQCPDWCTRQVNEGDYEQHLSEWATVLDGTDDDPKVVVVARARRGWWDGNGPETNSPGSIELALHGNVHPHQLEDDPAIKDAVAHLFLTAGEWTELVDNCEPLRAAAQMEGHEWEWSYDGAEDDADPPEEK